MTNPPTRRQILRQIIRVILYALILTASLIFVATSLETPTWQSQAIKEPPVGQVNVIPMIVDSTSEKPPAAATRPNPVEGGKTEDERVQNRELTVDLSRGRSFPSSEQKVETVYSAFDFLRDYLTNRTFAIIVDGKPWTNSTVNFEQYQEELGGVAYWDYFSEPEDWDEPSHLWQDDDGKWHPYQKQVIRDPTGQERTAYLLVDRKGPGVMDKIWFAEDAVWMLSTPQAGRDIGVIDNMDDFVEWGNLDRLGNLRIEVDDQIAYAGSLRDWISGKAWQWTAELVQALTWRHREYGTSGSVLPVPYQKHLRVLVYGGSKKPKWFLATGVRFAENVRVKPYTGTKTDLPLDEMARLTRNVLQPENYIGTLDDARAFDLSVQPKSAAVIQFNGAGTINALQFRIAKKYDPKQLWMRIKNGGQIAVNLPLIAFFSDPKQLALHRSTPLGVVESDGAYWFYCNLPLPFQSGLTIELTTNSPNPLVVSARFATSRETTNTQLWVDYKETEKLSVYGADYQVKLTGDGKLVGLILVAEDQDLERIPKIYVPGKPEEEDPVKRAWPNGYLEGNLSLTDGAGDSRIYGGQEDWADGGFYFNRGYTSPPGGSNRPFGGILRYRDGKDGYATLFRYFNDLSAFRFKNGLVLSFGHGTWRNNFAVSYGTTVYYYKEIKGDEKIGN